MKMPGFFKEYMRLIDDELVFDEILELITEYNYKINSVKPGGNDADFSRYYLQLREEYLIKIRNIAKPCIRDQFAFEEIVWKQNSEIKELKSGLV